jgi:hypothetical protein
MYKFATLDCLVQSDHCVEELLFVDMFCMGAERYVINDFKKFEIIVVSRTTIGSQQYLLYVVCVFFSQPFNQGIKCSITSYLSASKSDLVFETVMPTLIVDADPVGFEFI